MKEWHRNCNRKSVTSSTRAHLNPKGFSKHSTRSRHSNFGWMMCNTLVRTCRFIKHPWIEFTVCSGLVAAERGGRRISEDRGGTGESSRRTRIARKGVPPAKCAGPSTWAGIEGACSLGSKSESRAEDTRNRQLTYRYECGGLNTHSHFYIFLTVCTGDSQSAPGDSINNSVHWTWCSRAATREDSSVETKYFGLEPSERSAHWCRRLLEEVYAFACGAISQTRGICVNLGSLISAWSIMIQVDVEVSIAKRTRMLRELSCQKKDETWLQFFCLCVTSVFIILLCLVWKAVLRIIHIKRRTNIASK